MKKIYKPQTFLTVILNPKTKDKKPLFLYTQLSQFMKKNYAFLLLACLLFFGGNSFGQTASVVLRPSYTNLAATTSESAILVTASSYSSNDARYRIFIGSNQYNCWDGSTYVTSITYADGPQIPGTPSTSSTFWVLFQRGNNNSTTGTYRDRLGAAYGSNYQSATLPASTAVPASPYTLTGTVTACASPSYPLTNKYVVLAFDATTGGTLIVAGSTNITTGTFSIPVPNSITIRRVEIRSVNNTILQSVTGTWNSSTSIGTSISLCSGTNYYWNGGQSSPQSANWNAGLWYTTTGATTGGIAWPSTGSTNVANFANAQGGTVTLPATYNTTPSNIVLTQNNLYTFNTAASIPSTLSSTIDLGANKLTLSPNATAAAITLSGIISGSGGNLTTNTGATTLSAANTFTGGVTLSSGTLNINNASALGTTAGTFVINGGTIDNTSGSAITTSNYPQTWGGDFTFTGTNNLNLGTGAVSMGASRTVTTSGGILTVGGIISGSSYNLTKAGTGVLIFSGANTYTGTTTISNGTLALGAANRISNSSNIILSGGTFSTGTSTGYDETVGTLSLQSNSTIALGIGSHILNFSASNGVSWTGSTVLTITGWTGTIGNCSAGTAGRILVGSANTALTVDQLAQIKFNISGVDYPARLLSTGELVPTLKLSIDIIGIQTEGVGFSVTVTAKDFNNNSIALGTNTVITLTSTNAITGTTTGTITIGNNSVTITGVILDAGTNATITATASSGLTCLFPFTSNTFDVSASTVAKCPSSTSVTPAATQTRCVGTAANELTDAITTSGVTGTPTSQYQWYYNTTNSNTVIGATLISGATGDKYTPLTTATEVGTRYYFCVGYAADNTCAQTNATQTLASNTVQVTVNTVPANPTGSITVSNNPSCGPATLSYTTGFYWQTTPGTDASSPTSSNYTLNSTGTTYVRAYNGNCWSALTINTGTVTVVPAPSITDDADDASVIEGNTANFSVTVSNATSYQWQISTDGGTIWSNIATGASYTTPATTLAMNGNKYKCIISGNSPCTTIESAVATLTVTTPPAVSYPGGSYLSKTGMGLDYQTASTWCRCPNPGPCTGLVGNGNGGWGLWGGGTPSAASTVFIQGEVTLSNALGVTNSTILSGGNLIVANQHPVSNSMTIKSGGTVTNNDRLNFSNSAVTFTIEDGGNLILNSYQNNPNSALWNGVETFGANSNVYVNYGDQNADPSSKGALFSPESAITNNPATSSKFGNLILQPTTFDQTGHWTGVFPTGTYQLTKGDFTVNNNSDRNFTFSSTGSSNITVGGNMYVNQTTSTDVATSSVSGNSLTVLGNVTTNGTSTGVFRLNGAGDYNLNITGNLNINSGTFRFGGYLPSTISNLNLKGNLFINTNAILTGADAAAFDNNRFNFSGNGNIQTIDAKASGTGKNQYISFFVKQGAYAQLINQNFKLGQNSSLTVETGSTFDFGFDGVNGAGSTALNLTGYGITGTGFTSQSQAYLKISSPLGIVTTSGSVGNIQTNTAPTINTLETFHYIGKENQHTGNGIGNSPNGRAVIVDLIDNNTSLTPDVSFGVTATPYSYINSNNGGILDIRKGKFIETESEYVFGSDGALKMEPGTLYKIVKGYGSPLAAGTEPASPNNFIPRMNGTYTLNGGTIELGGNSAGNYFQTLRGGKSYMNVKYSGSNTYVYPTNSSYTYKNLTSNVTINDSLYISENAVLDCIDRSGTAASFEGDGGLVMDGGRIRIKNSSTTQPELKGNNEDYILTGGTVEFYGTSATQQQQIRGNFRTAPSTPVKINYYNIDINASAANLQTFSSTPNSTQLGSVGNVDMNSSFELTGNLNVNSPAVLRMDQSDFVDNGTGTSQTFNVNAGAGLLYANENGIKTSGTGINDGNIRTSGTRTFSSLANYGFVSSGDMVSGNGLPSSVAGLYIYKEYFANTVTLNNGGTLVNGILGLQKGKIASSDAQKVTLAVVATSDIKSPVNAGGIQDMGYDSSFVSGKMGHNSTSTSELILPIGSNTVYGPCAITPKNGTTQTYNGEYTSSGYGTYTLDPSNSPQLDHVSLVEYWNINSSITPSANDDAKIKLFWRAHSAVNSTTSSDWNNLRVVHFDGTDWNTEDNNAGAAQVSGVSKNWGSVISYNDCANFSPFTLGTITSTNPLPVELISFNGVCEDGEIKINWSTASEFNSQAFLVQRSEDGIQFQTIATVPSAGNSAQLRTYSIIDASTETTSNYYRLVEIDQDGKQTIYSFIHVRCGEVNGMNVYYNQPNVVVEVSSTTDKPISLNVFEISGKLIHQENKLVQRGYNSFNLNLKNKLADGIYIIQVIDEKSIQAKKVMVH
jgi:autotransporter-associated beta strand protein